MDCVPTGIYECNQNCACSSQCFNRVVQNGIGLRLQVFKTENRGWGLRTCDDIPIGTFICTYSGQVMNEDMANKEGRDFGDEYLAELDHIEVVEKIKEGYESSVSDIEDDSVILKTLDGGSSGCSDNGFMSDSDISSDIDSVISDNSSLYEPVYCDTVTAKTKNQRKEARKQSDVNTSQSKDDAVIIKEDGKMFRVSMADERYVVASSSNTGSIVLRRISVPSEDTANHQSNVSLRQDPCGDPPPMQCEPTVIDLTSSDEDESISFPIETHNKQSTDDDAGDGGGGDDDSDVKSTSKPSSCFGDHFDLCLDISTESTESCDMDQDQGHVTDTAVSSQEINGSTSDEELRHNSCHDNSDVRMDSTKESDNMDLKYETSDGSHKGDTSTYSKNDIEISLGALDNTKKIPDSNTDEKLSTETLAKNDCGAKHNKPLEKCEENDFKVNSGDHGSHGNSNHDNDKGIENQSEHGDVDCNHDNSKGQVDNEKEVAISDQELNMNVDEKNIDRFNHVTVNHDPQSSSASSDDNVPPLMSADDLSKLAAQLHQPDEEPPKLTKMECGLRLTDLKDTITKLQSRGVALDGVSPDTVQESTSSFEDLPLFPESSSCDVESFPPSPASTDSDSSVTDSIEKSSDGSRHRNLRVKSNSNARRARRFIVTLQKNGIKRSASPSMTGDHPVKKPTTRSLFDEEHCYVIDAKAYGNCGRYLNHSCSPNLFVQNVFIDTHDLRFPRVAFFAQHNISAGSELTWDYMYEVGSVQDKVLRCYCGSSQCRGRLL